MAVVIVVVVALTSHPQTFVSDILVAVNPFKQLPIYSPEVIVTVQHDTELTLHRTRPCTTRRPDMSCHPTCTPLLMRATTTCLRTSKTSAVLSGTRVRIIIRLTMSQW